MSNDFLDKIKTSPCYLFLGQNYLDYGKGYNPLLKGLEKQYNISVNDFKPNHNMLFEISLKEDYNSIMSWLQNRSNKTPMPDWLNEISSIPWNGVFTSSIDTIVEKSLQTHWREIQPIYTNDRYPKDYRSKTKLHLTYLFGCINQDHKNDRPPFNKFEFRIAEQRAINLFNRINKEFLTPFGILVIDGYNAENDWLKPDYLYTSVIELDKHQVYMFGVNEETNSNPFIQELVKNDRLITSPLSLYETLISNESKYEFNDLITEDFSFQKRISINKHTVLLPKDLFNNVSQFGEIVDDTVLLPADEFENDSESKEIFRNFLYSSSIKPVWEAYKQGFNVEREVEQKVYENVINNIENKHILKTHPIILHGQTGTGKTVSLGKIAFKLKKTRKYPIIFIPKNSQSVVYSVIDDFCKWAEDHGAEKTIIIWDNTVYDKTLDSYFDLVNYLVSKGRKIVLICSAYKLKNETIKNFKGTFIEAPVELNEKERENFAIIFDKYSGNTSKLMDLWNSDFDNNFLVALYRLLPSTKSTIRKGLVSEIEIYSKTFGEILNVPKNKEFTPMELAFIDSGVDIEIFKDSFKSSLKSDFETISNVVSVIGQFGLGIPIELLLRTLEGNFNLELAEIINKLDYFYISYSVKGNLIVYPRHKLEAQIVAQTKLTSDEQVNIIMNIIQHVKSGDFLRNDELDFLVELLKSIGPNNGEQTSRYKSHYKNISYALRELRLTDNVYNSRTILQEASYIREYVKYEQNLTIEDKLDLLKQTELILQSEISEFSTSDIKAKFLGTFLIELSSNLGTQLKYLLEIKSSKKELIHLTEQIHSTLKMSQIYSTELYYPIDIWSWTTRDLLESNILSQDESNEFCANLFAIFEKAETENPEIIFREDYNERLQLLGNLSGYQNLSNEAFENLLSMGSAAGIYLRAKDIISNVELSRPINEKQAKLCLQALEYLESYKEIVYTDERTLYLSLKLYWISKNKVPLFYNEKQVLNFSKEDWLYLNTLLDKIIELNDNNTTSQIKYLKAISLFHLNQIIECNRVFNEIRNNYYIGARRIIITYLASSNQGKTLIFTGQLQSYDSNRALFYIPELRINVPYFNKNFISNEPTIKSTFSHLTLGFNYLGIQVASHLGGV